MAEIAKQVDQLPHERQEQVLRFVRSLSGTASAAVVVGESGAALRGFSSFLDAESAREMMEAIEDGCEQIDASGA